MIRLGLVGYPLLHSLSPRLHAAAFEMLGLEGEYSLYPVAPDDNGGIADLLGRLRTGELHGLNVTIPHKQAVLSLLAKLTPSAQAIGAVNTIYLKDGKLVGHNTDAPGFLADLGRFLSDGYPAKTALVMGAGGAARAVVYALLTGGWKVKLAVRRADIGQADILIDSFYPQEGAGLLQSVLLEASPLREFVNGIGLIVNATPIGMLPDVESSPWPAGLSFPPGAAVYDLVYNPRQTRLVRDARAAGLRAVTGLGMLVEQAALSFACWTGRDAPREVMITAVEA